jgi:hypothetical protein
MPSKIKDTPNTCKKPNLSLKIIHPTSAVDIISPEDAIGNATDKGKARKINTHTPAPDA